MSNVIDFKNGKQYSVSSAAAEHNITRITIDIDGVESREEALNKAFAIILHELKPKLRRTINIMDCVVQFIKAILYFVFWFCVCLLVCTAIYGFL